jgi:hypothetical protein
MASTNFDLAFDERLFLDRYRLFRVDGETGGNASAREIYSREPLARLVSPNPQFDEVWYRREYGDVAEAIASGELLSGFAHFCDHGYAEGRMPSGWWLTSRNGRIRSILPDGATVGDDLRRDVEATALMAALPFIDERLFVRDYGLRPQVVVASHSSAMEAMADEFDPDFYIDQLPPDEPPPAKHAAFSHYLTTGQRRGLSPHAGFNERFYLAYYTDVRDAIRAGWLKSGFEHFVLTGRKEGRLPAHDPVAVLEHALPGVTSPELIRRATDMAQRLRSPRVIVRGHGQRSTWVFLPRLDPDFIYAGYRALFELIVALTSQGGFADRRLRLVVTEQAAANIEYFIHRTKDQRLVTCLRGADVVHWPKLDEICVTADDCFVAYSAWDAHLASPIAIRTNNPHVLQLIQEYEPIFYEHNSFHAMVDAAFRLPGFPVFNSAGLADYFRRNRIGLFAAHPDAVEGQDFLTFPHVITAARCATTAEMAARDRHVCLVYARPERHASRNLFEIVLLALRQACQLGAFDDSWRFLGVGTMGTKDPVPLAAGHVLELLPKQSEAEYSKLLTSTDLGISFMYAPHPSVVPYEMCSAGAVVVTNFYGTRDAAYFSNISRNFVACQPDLDSAAEAIREAVGRVAHHADRVANAYRPSRTRWADVFDKDFVEACERGMKSRQSPLSAGLGQRNALEPTNHEEALTR